jgi:hypothetical protein
LVSVVVCLGGCAATGEVKLTPALKPGEGEPVGWLAASLGARGVEFAPLDHNAIHFEPVAARGSGQLQLYVVGTSEEYPPEIDVVVDSRYFLHTYLVPLRPGEYSVTKGKMASDNGTVARQAESKRDPAIVFTIEPNTVTYLGSYVAEVFGGENLFGMRVPAGGYFVVTDEQARDIDLLKKKGEWPAAAVGVVTAVPDWVRDDSMFVRHRPGDGKGLMLPFSGDGEGKRE